MSKLKKVFHISIIIPTLNEEKNIKPLLERIDGALKETAIDYEVIFIDDRSTDKTCQMIKFFQPAYPVSLYLKKGKKGKAFSILEGIEYAKHDLIVLLDGDLQYGPENIPVMVVKSNRFGVVVGNRRKNRNGIFRKIASRINTVVTSKMLLGIEADTQSGLKVVRKEIFNHLDRSNIGPWSLDIPLLNTAYELGYDIGSVDITFDKRINGTSKINFLTAAIEILSGAVKVKLHRKKVYPITPLKNGSMLGAGIVHKRRNYITHTTLSQKQSAIATLTFPQLMFLAVIFIIFAAGLLFNPLGLLKLTVAIISSVYFIDVIFNLFLLSKSLKKDIEIKISSDELRQLDVTNLPLYSILCPLYREAHLIPQFVKSLDQLDWPKDKLEVVLLLEADDSETIDKVRQIKLPGYIRSEIVPESEPKTKPKACNYGLNIIRGEYVVIYDAEDIPDPQQLMKAYLGFAKAGPRVICLQAKLNYYNPNQNLLTRLFTAEYSLWFDIILPGLQSIETSIPLGGTSNHFRRQDLLNLKAWDPFNVTEDCDLGVRLFKKGFKTAIFDSTTMEEANSNAKNWLRQRSRWIKGYIQTYLVHMRHPFAYLKEHGTHALIFQLIIGGRIAFLFINPFLWLATISYFALRAQVGAAIEAVYPAAVFYIAVSSLVFGNFMYLYYYMIACAKKNHWHLVKYIFLVPFYWLMASVSAGLALVQIIFKPFYWEKTIHGFHLSIPIQDFVAAEKPKRARFSYLYKFMHIGRMKFQNMLNFLDLIFGQQTPDIKPNGKPRILIFNWRDIRHTWAGGAESYIHNIAAQWVRQGSKVTIFCGNDGTQEKTDEIDGVRIIRRGGFYSLYFWAVLYYIFHLRRSVDIVVDSGNGIPFFTPLYVFKPKYLLIYHMHQEVFRRHLPLVLSNLAQFLERRLVPFIYRNQKIITISESSKEEIVRLRLADPNNVFIVNPGIDFEKFNLLPKTDFPLITYLGRLKPYKNIHIVIEAFVHILYRHPDAQLFIAGSGESQFFLNDLVAKLGIGESVFIIGKVSEMEKRALLARSWLVVQPSSAEGWGMTVIEANAAGTPVVASDIPGLRDSVIHKSTGILVPAGDIMAFTEAINSLISDRRILDRLAISAYSWAKNFNWKESSEKFYRLINYSPEPYFSLEFKRLELN
ncbi:MAG: family 2 glycosyl transferase [Candidatus Gottesmanbacteria bacterium GW2011_GWA2_43_14]|uniref:Family 2 glycosyl transferase n=1 Tax=Candidatus Gottesmanbacteria bacterium GW2011_GWA2_43_14 TaxID=1618443 RepID=A0A0G1DKM8_9BACT|nr:MAG: family 2 glycosyl transferase [Candidatus Gottesmanbacteria bacterium GW2011_GWA2_43_14]